MPKKKYPTIKKYPLFPRSGYPTVASELRICPACGKSDWFIPGAAIPVCHLTPDCRKKKTFGGTRMLKASSQQTQEAKQRESI